MPILLVAIGAVLFISGVRGTVTQLAGQLRQDFTGANSFLYWCFAVLLIGAVGAIGGKWRTASRAFLALTVIAFVLANRGVIQNFQTAIASPPPPSPVDQNQQVQPGATQSAAPGSGQSQVPGMAQGGLNRRAPGSATSNLSGQAYANSNGLTDVNSAPAGTFGNGGLTDINSVPAGTFDMGAVANTTAGLDTSSLLSGLDSSSLVLGALY